MIIRALYDTSYLTLDFNDGDEALKLNSVSGVKQGENLSPTLFNIMIQAAMDTMSWPGDCEPLEFKTAPDGIMNMRGKARSNHTVVKAESTSCFR